MLVFDKEYMMLKFIKYFKILCLSTSVLLVGCSNTPNNVNLTANPGICVQLTQYNKNIQQQVLNLFPYLSNNPALSPYCMSFTIINNNSGVNANNIQITNSGLQVTYFNSSNTLVTTSLFDPNSSGIATLSGFSQTAGSLTLFDPYNCATTTSSNVVTLSANGSSCTFYVQMNAESYPVGIYPYLFNYNYTNGNANYTLTNNINQRVFMYGITQDKQLYSFIYNQAQYPNLSSFFSSPVSWAPVQNTVNIPPLNSNLVRSTNGYLYLSSNNAVYLYNGVTYSQLGNTFISRVNTLAIDPTGVIYAATSSGIYYLANNNWVQLTDSAGILSSTASISSLSFSTISPANYMMYVSTSPIFALYSCSLSVSNSIPTINCGANSVVLPVNSLSSQYIFNNINNTLLLIDPSSSNVVSYYIYLNPGWNKLQSDTLDSNFDQIYYNAVSNNQKDTLYIGLGYNVGPNTGNSIVYSCVVTPASLCQVVNSQGNATESGSGLLGSATSLILDGQQNLYVSGITLNSDDWVSQTPVSSIVTAILLPKSSSIPFWIPIIGSRQITGMIISSVLTSY